MGATIRNPNALHGKPVVLTRKGRDVSGILVAKDSRPNSNNFAFKWQDESGVCIDSVSSDELKNIKEDMNPVLPPADKVTKTEDKQKQVKSKKG